MSLQVIHKTDTSKSPLLQPVIQRDYTAGFNFNQGTGGGAAPEPDNSVRPPDPGHSAPPPPPPGGTQAPNFTAPPPGQSGPVSDTTREFSFEAENDNPSDLGEGENADVTMPTGSARTFANFVGNAIQVYLPKASYGYVKIDMDDVQMNVQKGILTLNFVEVFEKMNASAEESLRIPDENIKMWKSAFQHYLEYKQVKFANPETEFWAATALLLGDQGVRVYGLKKHMEKLMRDAIEACNPGIFEKKARQTAPEEKTSKTTQNESDSIAA